MNAIRGTYRLIYEDLSWFLRLFSFITVLLAAVYVVIGVVFDLRIPTSLFGPMYGGICTIAAVGLFFPFHIAIALGSTRAQFLKSYYVITTWMVIVGIFVLNIVYLIMNFLYQSGIHELSFYHPGYFYSQEYHFLNYFWIDLMLGFLLLGFSSFLTACWRRLGARNFFIIFFSINLPLTLLMSKLNLASFLEWFSQVNILLLFTLLGSSGWILLALTYPVMKNAPLAMKGRSS
ncbi:hypothetical protein WAK64_07990 [Bacillus spongiae]|uniref:Uncharacterized protein n=1 Tax=Bacillus spongiae TaxID=2683610 RepID=A0ABU8HCD3_9BACI